MELNFKVFGQGQPLIILHGLFGSLDNWQTIAKKFGDHFTVFILDQRNHGKSPHLETMDYQSLSEDLLSFMESNWIYESFILGHSMGGKTAMKFALDNPDFVDKLVVVDIAPDKNEAGHTSIFEALLGLDVETITSRSEAEDQLKKRIPESAVRQFLLKNLRRAEEQKFSWKMNLSAIHKNYENILSSVESTTPFMKETLFIKGGKSDYITNQNEAKISELFPNSSIKTIKSSGHWVHSEAPEEFYNVVLNFLKSDSA